MRLSWLSNKTWKREVAFVILLWLIYLSVMGPVGSLEIVVFPAFVFIYGAFGLDAYIKGIMPSRGDESSVVRTTESIKSTDRGRS